MQLNGFSKTSVLTNTTRQAKSYLHPRFTPQSHQHAPQFGFMQFPDLEKLMKDGLKILAVVAAGSAAIGGGVVYWATQGNSSSPKEPPTVQTPSQQPAGEIDVTKKAGAR